MNSADILPYSAVFTGGAACAVFFLRQYAKGWLDDLFAKKRDEFRHEQARDMEATRFQIARMLDRTVKLHQRELDITPKLLAEVVNAYARVVSLTSPLQMHADVAPMSDDQLTRFLEGNKFSIDQIAHVMASPDRNRGFQKMKYIRNAFAAGRHLRKSYMSLLKVGVFVHQPIYTEIDEFIALMRLAVVEFGMTQEEDMRGVEHLKLDEFRREGEKRSERLGLMVRERLWSAIDLTREAVPGLPPT